MKTEKLRDYEKNIVEIMIMEDCSFREAMEIIFDMNEVDKNSVFSLVDFLEDELVDLHTVEYYMKIWTSDANDMVLRPE